jgi:hypothetical protein
MPMLALPIGLLIIRFFTGDNGNLSGINVLNIVAKGENGDAYGRLFNINWFTFEK